MNKRVEYLGWEEYFMALARLSGMRSKDPSTQVGACIVKDNRILSIGYNGTPNGFDDDSFPWDRDGDYMDTKYPFVCHAELNAILNFRGNRRELEGATIYVDLFPCNECAKLIVQSGISEVVYMSDKYSSLPIYKSSRELMSKCKINFRQLETRKNINIEIKPD